MSEGVKFDTGKLRYDLVPWDAFQEVVKVLNYGATKYSSRNWEQGMDWGRLFAAGMRHRVAWWVPFENDRDPETAIYHLAHSICDDLFLLAYVLRGVGKDDRPKYTHVKVTEDEA